MPVVWPLRRLGLSHGYKMLGMGTSKNVSLSGRNGSRPTYADTTILITAGSEQSRPTAGSCRHPASQSVTHGAEQADSGVLPPHGQSVCLSLTDIQSHTEHGRWNPDRVGQSVSRATARQSQIRITRYRRHVITQISLNNTHVT